MGWLLRVLEGLRLVEPEGSRRDSMPAVAPLDDHVDLGRCDLYDLLLAIEEVFPQDAVLRLHGPSGAVREFLEIRASAANRSDYDLPLDSSAFSEFQALAARSAEPEIGMHVFVYRRGSMLLEAYDCDTWVVTDLPPKAISRLRQTILP